MKPFSLTEVKFGMNLRKKQIRCLEGYFKEIERKQKIQQGSFSVFQTGSFKRITRRKEAKSEKRRMRALEATAQQLYEFSRTLSVSNGNPAFKNFSEKTERILETLRSRWIPEYRLSSAEAVLLETNKERGLSESSSELLCFFKSLEKALQACLVPWRTITVVTFQELKSKFWQVNLDSLDNEKLRRVVQLAPKLYNCISSENGTSFHLEGFEHHSDYSSRLFKSREEYFNKKLLVYTSTVEDPHASARRSVVLGERASSRAQKFIKLREKITEAVKKKEAELSVIKTNFSIVQNPALLIEICQKLKAIFISRNVSNMYLISVLKQFEHKVNLTIILEENDIRAALCRIAAIVPQWLKFIDNKTGTIIRIDHKMPLSMVIEMFYHH